MIHRVCSVIPISNIKPIFFFKSAVVMNYFNNKQYLCISAVHPLRCTAPQRTYLSSYGSGIVVSSVVTYMQEWPR